MPLLVSRTFCSVQYDSSYVSDDACCSPGSKMWRNSALQEFKLTFLSALSDACTSFRALHILRNGHAYDSTIDILPIEPPDSGQCRLCILIHDGAITLGGACLFVAVDADLWFTGAVVQLAQKVQAAD